MAINLVISTTLPLVCLYAQIDACMCACPMCRACICMRIYIRLVINCVHARTQIYRGIDLHVCKATIHFETEKYTF